MNDLLDALAEAALNGQQAQAKIELELDDGTTKAVRVIVVAEDLEDEVDATDDFLGQGRLVDTTDDFLGQGSSAFSVHLKNVLNEYAEQGDTEAAGVVQLYRDILEEAFKYTGGLSPQQWLEVYAYAIDGSADFTENELAMQLLSKVFKKGMKQ